MTGQSPTDSNSDFGVLRSRCYGFFFLVTFCLVVVNVFTSNGIMHFAVAGLLIPVDQNSKIKLNYFAHVSCFRHVKETKSVCLAPPQNCVNINC